MDPRELADQYLEGRMNSWGVFRQLRRLGVTAATALALVTALPTIVQTHGSTLPAGLTQSEEELHVLELFLSHLVDKLELVSQGGPIRPLATTLARIGANNANMDNCDCAIDINVNNETATLRGELKPEGQNNENLNLNLDGNIGETNVNLDGNINLPADDSNGLNVNLGAVHLNFALNFDGNAPLNFEGNLNNLSIGKANE